MTAVFVIAVVTCVGLISDVLIKPSMTVKGVQFSVYPLVVILGVAAYLAGGFITLREIGNGLTAASSINPIEILVLFLSMTILSIFLDEVGFFRYLANRTLRRAKASQWGLFFNLYMIVSVLTVFTSNDIIILTFTPFICYFAKSAKINPIPYLFAEFVAANTWSMMLVIGNPTNVYLATANGINFMEYVRVMFLPTMIGGITALLMLSLVFRKHLDRQISPCTEEVTIRDRGLLMIGLAHLGLCTLLLVLSSYLGFAMWKITFAFAVSLFAMTMIYQKIHHRNLSALGQCLKRAPWELIPFVLSMFVLVLTLDKYGITERMAELLQGGNTVFRYGISSFLMANLMNNIPMSVLYSTLVQSITPALLPQGIYAAIVGSNIGAFFTPIGALAGIMWSGILKKQEVKFGFLQFIRYGAIIAGPTLVMTLAGVWMVL